VLLLMIEPLSWEFRDEQRDNPFRRVHTTVEDNLARLGASECFLGTSVGNRPAPRIVRIGRNRAVRDQTRRTELHRDRANTGARTCLLRVKVWTQGQITRGTYISYPEQEFTTANALARNDDLKNPEVQAVLKDVLVSRAHMRLDRDLLVTESK
jgi:hypothetical protein